MKLISSAVLALTLSSTSFAGDYSIVHHFNATKHDDGAIPRAGLVADGAGNVYGTTFSGGGGNGCSGGTGCGTVFKIAPDGTETVLYRFTGGADGGSPSGDLVIDGHGNLYGTTQVGGLDQYCTWGCGVVFKVSADGVESTLYAFKGDTDGAWPAGLVRGPKGVLYGVTEQGGGNGCHGYGCGTLYKLAPGKQAIVLYTFVDGADGRFPAPGLVLDKQGNLFGAVGGGGGACDCGNIFELAANGTMTQLYAFAGGADGNNPSPVIADGEGNLFGTTEFGGGASACGTWGCGTIFEVTPAGKETVLYRFLGGDDGAIPFASLIRDKHANLYGTTSGYGSYRHGTVFKLSPANQLRVLHEFGSVKKDGANSTARLLQVGGYVYGTTQDITFSCDGGACGTVFRSRR